MCRFVPLCASPRRCSDVVFGVKGDPRRPEESQEASSRLGRLKLAKRHPKGSTTEVLGRRKKAEVRLMCDSQTFCSLHHMNRPHTHTHTHTTFTFRTGHFCGFALFRSDHLVKVFLSCGRGPVPCVLPTSTALR